MIEKTRARPAMGTFVVMSAAGPRPAVELGLRRAFDAVERAENRLSYFRSGSDVSRLNRDAHRIPVRVHPQTHRLLRAAARLSRLSGGVFDVTVGGALWRGGFRPVVPSGPVPDPAATARDIRLLPGHRVRFRRPLWIDLGGIAKGHIVDRALAVLREAGVRRARVNAGGDTAGFGGGDPLWRRDGRSQSRIHFLGGALPAACATSAPFYHVRGRGRRRRAPYVVAGRCQPLDGTVTLAAPRALWADALTKVALLDPARARTLMPLFKARRLI